MLKSSILRRYGCWIGFQDLGREGGFVWFDGSSVSFVDFAPGEPNGVNDAGDEDAVELGKTLCATLFLP
jgi:hypothetical protein